MQVFEHFFLNYNTSKNTESAHKSKIFCIFLLKMSRLFIYFLYFCTDFVDERQVQTSFNFALINEQLPEVDLFTVAI